MASLGDKTLFQIESGGTPSSGVEGYWNGGINWATLADLPAENLITEVAQTQRTISAAGLGNSSAKLLPVGTVLVSTRATIGRVAISKTELATNQGFKNIIVLDAKRVSNEYIAYMMTTMTEKLLALASGGTFKEVSKNNFLTLEIPLPPLDIQEQIVKKVKESQQTIHDLQSQIISEQKKISDTLNSVWEEEK